MSISKLPISLQGLNRRLTVYISRYFHLYLQKFIDKTKRKKAAEPHGQALAKRTCSNEKINGTNVSEKNRGFQA